VRPDVTARELAEKEGVDVRLYRVIYDAIDDIRGAVSGMLKPEERETELGRAEVRTLFRVPKLGVIAGCYVLQGTIVRNATAGSVRSAGSRTTCARSPRGTSAGSASRTSKT
jgi:translation initiation factor IF-2